MNFNEEQNASFFQFEDLRMNHKSLDYASWVYDKVSQAPSVLLESIGRHFIDATVTISLRMAQGSTRIQSENVQYLQMAKSSVRECVVYTSLLFELKQLSPEDAQKSHSTLEEITRMIGARIGSMERRSNKVNEYYQ